MINEHILLEKGKIAGFVQSTHSAWKIMALASAFCFVIALLKGCGEPNLDDPKVREKVLAEAIDEDNLQTRRAPSGEDLHYAPNQERPYNGWVKSERTLYQFQEGKRNGLYISWYSNNQNSEKGIFRNGQRNGLWTEWYENGQKSREEFYKSGKKNGLWTEWHENGEKASEGVYKNDIQDGLWTYWDENGQEYMEKYMEIICTDMGIMSSQLDDPKVRERLLSEAIKIDSHIMLTPITSRSGHPLYVPSYVRNKGQPYTGWGKFDRTGFNIYQFQRGKMHGLWIEYHENRQKRAVGFTRDGINDGLWIKWDGLWIEWYENGQKKIEGVYKNGIRDGLWTRWDKNGQQLWSEIYKDGEGEHDGGALTPIEQKTTQESAK